MPSSSHHQSQSQLASAHPSLSIVTEHVLASVLYWTRHFMAV